jgi:sugar lactone lactonase YvrE
MRYVLIGVLALLLLAAGYVLAWPVDFEPDEVPVGPNPGFTGPYAPNTALRSIRFLGDAMGTGPEDVTVKDGYAYTGVADGGIVRIRIDGQTATGPAPVPVLPGAPAPSSSALGVERFANTNGRPLGLQHDPFGNLVVADAKRGMLAITQTGQIFPIAQRYEGRPIAFADDLDIAKDGTIYFTEASTRHGIEEFALDIYEGKPTGRLFSFDPRSGQLQVRVSNLAFANGVALGPDEEFVLVNETAAHRIARYWLKGPKQGVQDRFAENLPGYPDNISFNGRDLFWVALAGPRIKLLEDQYKSPFMRRVMYRLSMIGLGALPVTPEPYGIVVAFDLQGQVVATLQDPGGRTINTITSVNERDGILYLGSLATDRIATFPLPPQLLKPR